MAAKATRQQAQDPGSDGRDDPGHAPGTAVVDQLHLARGDQPCGADVDHAATEHICAQEHLAGPPLELCEVQLCRRRARRLRVQPRDPLRGYEQLAAADPDLQPGHRRELIAGIKPRDQILDLAQSLTRGIKQRTADQPGQV